MSGLMHGRICFLKVSVNVDKIAALGASYSRIIETLPSLRHKSLIVSRLRDRG